MNIRKATSEDAEVLQNMTWEKGRNYKELISAQRLPSEVFVWELNQRIVGYTGLIYYDWNNTAQIMNMWIHSDHRRKGYGTKLVQFLIERVRDKGYRSLIAEAPSLNPVLMFYLKNGFRICGFNDRYYSNKGKEMALWVSYDFE